jgi:uncharacterized membrane protein YccC
VIAMAGWLAEVRDRVVASDPGLTRLRTAASAAATMGSSLGIEYMAASARHEGARGVLVAMLLGAVVGMMGSMALTGAGASVWDKVRTALFFPVAIGLGLLAGAAVSGSTDLLLGIFVAVMAAAVAVRRFGQPFFYYGFMGWMGYFFGSFLHATLPMLPSLIEAVVISAAWTLLLSLTVLRVSSSRTLRRTVRAFDARARAVARACADLLETSPAGRRRRRARQRLRSRRAQLAEAALMAEAWSAEPGALPPHRSAPGLRRRLIDAQHVLDRLAAAAVILAGSDHSGHGAGADGKGGDAGGSGALRAAAAGIAGLLARRDDAGAARAAGDLAEAALRAGQEARADGAGQEARDQGTAGSGEEGGEGSGEEGGEGSGKRGPSGGHAAPAWAADRPSAWQAAWYFAVAAAEFAGLALRDPAPLEAGPAPGEEDVNEFEPAAGLAMGYLPGSAAVARGVPARGSGRWNLVARLDLTARQAVQVAFSGGLAILAGHALSPVRYYWAVIATFIMFTGTATRSETYLKGLNRVLGTMAGLLAATWLADLTAGHTAWVLAVIVLSMFFGFYLQRVSYAYMVFFLTIMLGQLYSALEEFSIGLLVLRLEETALGAAIGFAVALAVVPLSTRDTVRAARGSFLTALAELLTAARARLGGAAAPDLDLLSRRLDDRMRQLALTARPLTLPLVPGSSPARTRPRLALYGAVTAHARALAVALRHPGPVPGEPRRGPAGGLPGACGDLAAAAGKIAEVPPGRPVPAAAGPLARAGDALIAAVPATSRGGAGKGAAIALIYLHHLLCDLAGTAAGPPGQASPAGQAAARGSPGAPRPPPDSARPRGAAGVPRDDAKPPRPASAWTRAPPPP